MASDYISKVKLATLVEEKIALCNTSGRVGPHGICCWGSNLIVANGYSHSISKIDIVRGKEIDSSYVGTHCNDIEVFGNEAYVTCGESNYIVVFDLYANKIVEEIPCGNLPHGIAINRNGLIAVSNMESDSITLLDCKNKEYSKEIKVGPYPTKVLFSGDGNLLYVCESNLGSDKRGSISVISTDNESVLARVRVGRSPVDMYCDAGVCYVSNFNEGTVSMVYVDDWEEVKRIEIGGMPRGIVKKGRYIYVGDNYGSVLVRYDIYKENKNVITIGGEPTGMTII